MGYEEHIAARLRKRSPSGRTPKLTFIFTLILGVIVSTFPNLASAQECAAQHHKTAVAHEHQMAGGLAHHPSGHKSECAKLTMHCCAQAASVAAIWTTLEVQPQSRAARCAAVSSESPSSYKIDPPTPPPRTV